MNAAESGSVPESKQRSLKNTSVVQNSNKVSHDGLTKRKAKAQIGDEEELRYGFNDEDDKLLKQSADKWKRILLLVIAITVHNIPGKLFFQSLSLNNSLSKNVLSNPQRA